MDTDVEIKFKLTAEEYKLLIDITSEKEIPVEGYIRWVVIGDLLKLRQIILSDSSV